MVNSDLELYVHIPFCARKCLYCDFLSFPAPIKTYQEYIRQLTGEVRSQGACFQDRQVVSIFLGGGTPSILPAGLVRDLFMALRECFQVREDAEITIEANPGTLTADRLKAYRDCGVNRISLGLQSADDAELRQLGRIHTFDEFLKSYQAARLAGFDNINVDLMSALPGQTVQSWRNTLRKVLMLRPEHISAYSLMIEEGTPFHEHYGGGRPEKAGEEKRGLDYVAVISRDRRLRGRGTPEIKSNYDGRSQKLQWPPLPDEDTDRELYHLTKEMLAEHGYGRYEISNYARQGRECRHNVGYWTGVEYLGLGLGASSYVAGYRYKNVSDFKRYMELDMGEAGAATCDIEELTQKGKMGEFMFLGLRMMKGVSGKEFLERFGENMWNVFADVLPKLKNQGLIEMNPPMVRLTERGIDVGNRVFGEFLLEEP